jgi:hypothetical protein
MCNAVLHLSYDINFLLLFHTKSNTKVSRKIMMYYTGCLKIREFRIQSVVGKDPVEREKYLEKKFALPEEDISTLILFNT